MSLNICKYRRDKTLMSAQPGDTSPALELEANHAHQPVRQFPASWPPLALPETRRVDTDGERPRGRR